MEHIRNGLIPIAVLPLDVRERMGITLPSERAEQPASTHVNIAPTPAPLPEKSWFDFWPYAISVVRKMEVAEGLPKQQQKNLMNFASSLPKPYNKVTETLIQEKYRTWRVEFEAHNTARNATPSVASAAQSSEVSTTIKEPLHTRRKNIPKHIKTLVWNKYIGAGVAESKCISCRQERIENRSFHCGHVLAEAKGGDMTINNLRPICSHCNLAMGTRSMSEFTEEFFGWTV
jgi:HNH endonuclease